MKVYHFYGSAYDEIRAVDVEVLTMKEENNHSHD